MNFDRSKIVAIVTGAIALLLGIAYLVIVQLLDFRGEMIPAPQMLLQALEGYSKPSLAPHRSVVGILCLMLAA